MDRLTVFVDTNVIIEHLAGNFDILELRDKFNALYSNSIVFSESLMVYLKALTGERPYTLKHKPELVKSHQTELRDFMRFFELFRELEVNRSVEELALEYMAKYGLLPNDAIILATCRVYGIKYLISFDNDFMEACAGEGMTLLDSPEAISKIIKMEKDT